MEDHGLRRCTPFSMDWLGRALTRKPYDLKMSQLTHPLVDVLILGWRSGAVDEDHSAFEPSI
jgi:hypothetical protein